MLLFASVDAMPNCGKRKNSDKIALPLFICDFALQMLILIAAGLQILRVGYMILLLIILVHQSTTK